MRGPRPERTQPTARLWDLLTTTFITTNDLPALTDTTYAIAAFKLVFVCGSMVLDQFMFFVFALCERENEKR
jgi:hypothetical protein